MFHCNTKKLKLIPNFFSQVLEIEIKWLKVKEDLLIKDAKRLLI
jgi:hypothetical protein